MDVLEHIFVCHLDDTLPVPEDVFLMDEEVDTTDPVLRDPDELEIL